MGLRTEVLTLAMMATCLSVAAADTLSQLQPGTYAVEHRKGLDYSETAGAKAKTLTIDAYLPQGVQRMVPAVVVVPGDAAMGDADAASGKPGENAAWLASHGYVAFVPDYRLEEGRRVAFRDVRAAVQFIRSHHEKFGVEPNRIGIWGCADGGKLAVSCALLDDPLPKSKNVQGPRQKEASKHEAEVPESISGRVQAVVATCKTNPVTDRLMKRVSFDDPPLLLLLASGDNEVGQLDAPQPFVDEGIDYAAYRVPGDRPCQALCETMAVGNEKHRVSQLVLGFFDEHLKEPPMNLVFDLERIILKRLQTQDRLLGTQSLIDLRAVLTLAARRLGREPTPEEMKVASQHAQEFADGLARTAALENEPPRISRVIFAEAVSRQSPLWPFTIEKRPATVPPVSRGNLLVPESRD